MEDTFTVRLLVVGNDNVGKSTLVQALCGASTNTIGKSIPGCVVSVRVADNGNHIEEFYDVSGAPRYRHGRQVFFSHPRYDGILFVYDLTDPATRSAISCTWVPEIMTYLGDIGAIEAGGRADADDLHVRSAGVINELRFLWRQLLFSHSSVSAKQALGEGARLMWRLARLLLNEWGIWTDSSLDQEAERVFLATSLVPVALVGMKLDLVDRSELREVGHGRTGKGVTEILLHANSAGHDPSLQAFLRRVAESARRKVPSHTRQSSNAGSSGQVMLGFS